VNLRQILFALALLAAALSQQVAAQAAATSIGGTLRARAGESLEPVAGVRLMARATPSGQVTSSTSGASGSFDIVVTAAGEYTVTLDASSLPSGVALENDRRASVTVEVQEGQRKLVLFPLERGGAQLRAQGPSLVVRILQLLVDGTIFGLIIAMGAVGLSLIYSVSRVINFAHGEFMTLGALVAFALSSMAGGPQWPLMLCAVVAVLAAGALGGVVGTRLLPALESRAKEHFALLIFTIGLSFTLRYLMLAIFESNTQPFREYALQQPLRFWQLAVAPRDAVVAGLATASLIGLGVLLMRTRLGRAMRAVASDPSLAGATGIDVDRIKRDVWILGSGLAGMGGVLMALSQQVRWDMGYQALMFVFAAVILGGVGTAFGTIAGGVVLGICMELSTVVFPVEIKSALAMIGLSLVLLLRPQGLFNRALRVG
jgi:neutral amino acid transport system permease protein